MDSAISLIESTLVAMIIFIVGWIILNELGNR